MEDAPSPRKDFFVSHSQVDSDWAVWIAWHIEDAGYSVFLSKWDFRGNVVIDIDEAHRNSSRTLAVVSDSYLESKFASAEWAARFASDPDGRKGSLVPVKVSKVTKESLINNLSSVDLTNLSEEDAKIALINRIRMFMDKNPQRKDKISPKYPGIFKSIFLERPLFPPENAIIDRLRYKYIFSMTGLLLAILFIILKLSLEPIPNTISVRGARFGVPNLGSCPFEASQQMKNCNGQESCIFRCSKESTCGDPTPTYAKQCHIDYACSKSGPMTLLIVGESPSADQTLKCPDFGRVDILQEKLSQTVSPFFSWLRALFR